MEKGPIKFIGQNQHMRVYLLFIFLFTCPALAFCQDSITVRKSNFDSTIKMIPTFSGRYRGIVYVASDNTPLFRLDIAQQLMNYEPSANEYARYKSSRVGTGVWTGVGIVSCVFGYANRNNPGTWKPFAFIAVAALVFEVINAIRSTNHFDRAIKLYNDHYRR